MPLLRRTDGAQEYALERETVVGRNPLANLVIPNPYVSGLHALVQQRGERWQLKDLGSHNGTILNGHKIVPGRLYDLMDGDRLAFGDRSVIWVLVDGRLPRRSQDTLKRFPTPDRNAS